MPKGSGYKKAGRTRSRAYAYGKSMLALASRGRRLNFNPSPTFTETYRLKNSSGVALDVLPNAGFMLAPSMGQLPQLTQYSNLYQKYRILKVAYLLVPNFSGGTDQNVAIFNTVSGNFPIIPGVSTSGTARIVYVIDNTPNQAVPVSEDAVLQENGCKIKFADKPVRMSCAPVPEIKDANNNEITLKKKFINFTTDNPNIAHYGIRGWCNHPFTIGTGSFNIADSLTYAVYVKLTFQVAEPR